MKERINRILIVVGIFTLLTLFWQLLEIAIDGKTSPSEADTLVGFILTASLYYNLKLSR